MSLYVEAEVIDIEPGGVIVRIENDTRAGFVRWDELTWDRSIRRKPPVPKLGSSLRTVIVRATKGARYVYLSTKRTTDPWKSVAKRFEVGQVVKGEVVSVRDFGVHVQLEPGIDALVRRHDVPHSTSGINDTLAIGDHVQGVISNIDLPKRHINLDIKDYLRNSIQLPQQDRLALQEDLFRSSLDVRDPDHLRGPLQGTDTDKDVSFTRFHQPISRLEAILYVDDNPETCELVCQELRTMLGITIDVVKTGDDALAEVQFGQMYQLAIIDLTLGDERGVDVAEELLTFNPELGIIFVSANLDAGKDIPAILGHRYPFAAKQFDEVLNWIEAWEDGFYEVEIRSVKEMNSGRGHFIRQLGMETLTQRSLAESLNELLLKLQKRTQATQVMVIEVDSATKKASCLAAEPPLDDYTSETFEDGLYFSPVRNVTEEHHDIYRRNVDPHANDEFKYFAPLLDFRSCFGLPLVISGLKTRHALFLLDTVRPEFELEDLDETRLIGQFIALAIERDQMLGFMRRFELRYSLGQLQNSLVHELTNKLTGVLPRTETLERQLFEAYSANEVADKNEMIALSRKIASDLTRDYQDIDELLQSYARIAKDDLEAVNTNDVVEKVVRQFETAAQDAGLEIHTELHSNLPQVRSISSRLEQILTNLLLNAVAQTGRYRNRLGHQFRLKRSNGGLMPGLILIQTRLSTKSALHPIQIIVSDTGPGIHCGKQEEIFLLDTSERERGHGLGLFISRSLAETMGGGVRLAESFMFFGSAFVIDLPVYTSNEELL